MQWAPRPPVTAPAAGSAGEEAEEADTETEPDDEAEACQACGGEAPPTCCPACFTGRAKKPSPCLTYGEEGAEKISADLEQRAVREAETLLRADGTICRERLRLLRLCFDEKFVRRTLSRVPFSALRELPEEDWDPVAMNTALLLEDFHEIRQWQEAPTSTRSVFPNRLISIFSSLEEELAFHSKLAPKQWRSTRVKLDPPSQALLPLGETVAVGKHKDLAWVALPEFRSLLRSLTHGILEGVPLLPNKLILGGSSMVCCLRRISPRIRAMCHAEARATAFEAKVAGGLVQQLGSTAGNLVMLFAAGDKGEIQPPTRGARSTQKATAGAGSWIQAQALRRKIREELRTKEWEDADVDLFVVAQDEVAKATVQECVTQLQRNISAATGGRRSTVLRTKNTLTVVGGWPFPNVQIVCKTVRACQELLVHADMDCSAMAYDGEQVFVAPRAARALATGFNFVPKQVLDQSTNPRHNRSIHRFAKYWRRGLGALVFEHCRHEPRCDLSAACSTGIQRLRSFKLPSEPKFSGSPRSKGRQLANWMTSHAVDLRRKKQKKVPEDGKEEGDDAQQRPESRPPGPRGSRLESGYPMFTDLLIPCSKGVCPDTLREYVQQLGRPDLLEEVTGPLAVDLGRKDKSDRKFWQDRYRGKCYTCKVAMGSKAGNWPLCPECSTFNEHKRQESADCTGRVAIVTGGRTKIGREVALKLLRAGAKVVVTTRFPLCALDRYRQEEDFEGFRERLLILGADFRHLQSVQRVVEEVTNRYQHIDILVHNAAQTIRRPPAYYESLRCREAELATLGDGDWTACEGVGGALAIGDGEWTKCETEAGAVAVPSSSGPSVSQVLSLMPKGIAEASGVAALAGDLEAELRKAEWFPPGEVDAHGEQRDLRPITSWTQKMEDIELPELAEVLAVNVVVPYLLTARWLALLRKSEGAFVIFVTSQEGSFNLAGTMTKNGTHPHTNVAKAGLNMLARTVGADVRRDGVFVSAVDPGWVSWMKPGGSQQAEQAPLTEADGAARVLDPVFSGMTALRKGRSPPTGVLFKDFVIVNW